MVYVKFFVDYLDAVEPLGDAEKGRLFTALLEYARTGEAPQLYGNERFLFPMMRAQIDRDEEALSEISLQRSEAGKKGAQAKMANAKFAKQEQAKLGKSSKDKDKDKEEDNIPPKSPQGGSVPGFDEFWAAYPKHMGKGNAEKAWEKLKPDAELVSCILSTIEKCKKSKQWNEDNGRFIPYPATWLNRKGWEDELEACTTRTSSYNIDELEELAFFDVPEEL